VNHVRRIFELGPDAPLDEADRALLALAYKMTREPGPMGPEHVERLRRAGLTDVAILEAANLIGFFNYINRVCDALGVEVEATRPKDVQALATWIRGRKGGRARRAGTKGRGPRPPTRRGRLTRARTS
jgi:hypothetical protein